MAALLFCGGGYLLFFLVNIKKEIDENRCFILRLACDYLYGEWLFTWLSLVMSSMVFYFVLSFFPRDVSDEIWDRIESVSENFPTYS